MTVDLWVVGGARAALAILLAVSCLTDLRARRIPNLVSGTAFVAALVWHALAPAGAGLFDPYMAGGLGFREALIGAMASLVLLVIPYGVGLLGAGDVKLLVALGAWVGISALPSFWLAVMLAGAALALVWALAVNDVSGSLGRTVAALRALLFRLMGLPGLALLEGRTNQEAPPAARLPFAIAITGGCAGYGLSVHQTLFG